MIGFYVVSVIFLDLKSKRVVSPHRTLSFDNKLFTHLRLVSGVKSYCVPVVMLVVKAWPNGGASICKLNYIWTCDGWPNSLKCLPSIASKSQKSQ